MNQTELDDILEKHRKWIANKDDGVRADLQGADLQGANLQRAGLQQANLQRAGLQQADLRGANLREANLREANLRGADLQGADLRWADLREADLREDNLKETNLRGADLQQADLRWADMDFSCLPLWCGSLGVHFDDRQIIQQLYHVIKNTQYSENISRKIKDILLTDELIALANQFHWADECGKIERQGVNL